MKKIFYILASAIVALGAMACQNEVDESINPNETKEISFKVSFDESTRIAMGELAGGKLPFEFDGKGLNGGPDSLYVGYSRFNGESYTTKRAFLVNSEENPYEFVADAENQAILQELVGEENIHVVNKNNETVVSADGENGLLFKSEEFDLVAGENEVKLSLACPAFYFTVPEGTEVVFSAKRGDNSVLTEIYHPIPEASLVSKVESLTFGEGTHIVGVNKSYNPEVTIAYSVNGVTVKEASLTLTDKVYNLGTLGYEFTTINTKEQLIAFAEHVNAGNSYEGKTVKLGNDIDLEGAEWTPIGNLDVIKYANVNSTFLGTFDGQGYTISNFTINQTGEAVGFFGVKYAGDIKDVKFDGVTVTGTHYGAVVVGWTDGAQRNADGQWNITGCEVKNSTVTLAPDTTPDNGDKAGAIVGYAYAINVTGNTVSNTTIQAYRDLGAIAGMAQENTKEATTVSGNTVGENVTVIVDNTVNYKNYTTAAQYNAGNYVGRISTNSVVENNTGEATIVLPKTAVEKLNEQIAAGESNITISESFEMTATDPRINIAEGQNVNITLAEGVEITGTFAESGSDALFNIAKGGELTIGGEGKIALTAVKGNVSNYGQYIFENCGGVLNITRGTYTMEVTGSGSATWFIPTLINNNSTSGETVTNISGGYFYSETCVNIMRQFINHKTATATFNITGGEFEGTGSKTYGIWNQNSGGSGLGYINISGNAQMNNVYVENDAPKANAVVWGGTFDYEPGTAASSYNAVTIKEDYKAIKNGTVWTVNKLEKSEWELSDNTPFYLTATDDLFVAYNVKLTSNNFCLHKVGDTTWGAGAKYGLVTAGTKNENTAIGLYSANWAGDITINNATTTAHDIYFDKANSRLYVLTVGKTPAEITAPTNTNSYNIAGTMNSWGDNIEGYKFTYAGDNVWHIVVDFAKDAEFKVQTNNDWNQPNYGIGRIQGGVGKTLFEGSDNAKVKAAGTYEIWVVPAHDDAPLYIIKK